MVVKNEINKKVKMIDIQYLRCKKSVGISLLIFTATDIKAFSKHFDSVGTTV